MRSAPGGTFQEVFKGPLGRHFLPPVTVFLVVAHARSGSGGRHFRKFSSSAPGGAQPEHATDYKRNRPHICSFWVKGECKRGDECPYRHEKPTDPDDPLADQNIKDRYYGTNDPVANKLMQRAQTMPELEPPADKNITTLYLGGVPKETTDQDIRNHFYQFGEIRAINVVEKQSCAFICFMTRASAQLAAERSFNKLFLHGRRINVKWGRSPALTRDEPSTSGGQSGSAYAPGNEVAALAPPPFPPGILPPPGMNQLYYPSMDPGRMGTFN